LLEPIDERMLDEFGIAMIGEAAGERGDKAELGFDLA
jgi:hypothetical protein